MLLHQVNISTQNSYHLSSHCFHSKLCFCMQGWEGSIYIYINICYLLCRDFINYNKLLCRCILFTGSEHINLHRFSVCSELKSFLFKFITFKIIKDRCRKMKKPLYRFYSDIVIHYVIKLNSLFQMHNASSISNPI